MNNKNFAQLIKQAGEELRAIEASRAKKEQAEPLYYQPPYIPTSGVSDAFATLRKQEIGNHYED